MGSEWQKKKTSVTDTCVSFQPVLKPSNHMGESHSAGRRGDVTEHPAQAAERLDFFSRTKEDVLL